MNEKIELLQTCAADPVGQTVQAINSSIDILVTSFANW